jgi:nucleoside-diphosphate-sugar epimerase
MSTEVFVLGATGYIGGAILTAFLHAFPQFSYKALVRNPSSFPAIEALGVRVIKGSHSDLAIIRDEASTSDIVVNCADADDLPLTEAILEGLKKKKERSGGGLPILLHTSGTGILTDKPTGEFTDWAKRIWDDNNPDDILGIKDDQLHRNVELKIFEAARKKLIASYIIAPSAIYGVAHKNPVNKISIQVPLIIRTAVEKKQAVYLGKGSNRWNNVHIDDLADLYILVLQHALQNKSTVIPEEEYYWGSVNDHAWGDIARLAGQILHKRGLVNTPEAKSVTKEELTEEFLVYVGHNSRSVANRGTKLGWKPHRKTIEENLEEDLDATVKKYNLQ